MHRTLLIALAMTAARANAQDANPRSSPLAAPPVDMRVVTATLERIWRTQSEMQIAFDDVPPRRGIYATKSSADSTTQTPNQHLPPISGYGSTVPLPEAAVQPDTTVQYKIVVDVTTAATKPDQPAPGLNQIAKLINLYGRSGVPRNHLDIVAVVHGPAVNAVLDSAHYQAVTHVENPNLNLIHQLRTVGVTVYVCGQSLVAQKYDPTWLAPGVVTALSALTVVSTYQLKGYALLPY